jgi:hypothetical protein
MLEADEQHMRKLTAQINALFAGEPASHVIAVSLGAVFEALLHTTQEERERLIPVFHRFFDNLAASKNRQ